MIIHLDFIIFSPYALIEKAFGNARRNILSYLLDFYVIEI